MEVPARLAAVAERLAASLGPHAVLSDPAELRTYECDGLARYAVSPGLVVLPESTEQVAEVVRACRDADLPFVARGSGTGLSGGALPRSDGVLIVTSRMRRILEVDLDAECAVVEPGVINLAISREVSPAHYHYAPDPSSQQICSIGGNVAENSGGAHCLKYGFTAHHVTGLEIVTPDGDVVWLGAGKCRQSTGYDLLGVFIGSEGTLGIATKVVVRLVQTQQCVETILAAFPDMASAGEAVSAIIAAGITPAAIEMMDALSIEAAEQAVDCRYPDGAGAVLIVELDGPADDVAAELAAVTARCEQSGAFELRRAADEYERGEIWKGRKSAFAAVGRISPDYIVQDGVIPRTALPEVLADIAALSQRTGIRVANVFHAGDGNLHPLVLYDESVPGQGDAAEEVSGAILDLCIGHGGSITGEHGVGVDKAKHLPKMFTADDLDTMQLVRCAFDPAQRCNPGKVFPTPRLCGEVPRRGTTPHPAQAAGLAEAF